MLSPLNVKCFYKVSFYWDILGAFHSGKKPGNFGESKSGISDW